MKITIDATPCELAELIFALTDCDVEIEEDTDDEEVDDEEELGLDKVRALNAIANILDMYSNLNKTTT